MRRRRISRHWMVFLGLAPMIGLTGCADVSEADSDARDEPVTIEMVDESSGQSQLTLTELAAERLAVATSPVSRERLARGSEGKRGYDVVPYSSLIYDPQGGTWVYVNPEPLLYMRERVAVAFIDGDAAALKSGPPLGAEVVSVGAAELYGAELGVDH